MSVYIVPGKLSDGMKYHVVFWKHTNCASHSNPRVRTHLAHRASLAANVLHGRVRR